MSREPSNDDKVQFPSIAELKDGLIALTNRLARRVKFRGRKLRPGPLMNALLLHFLALPEDEQARVIEMGLKRYETLLEYDTPQDALVSIPAEPPAAGKGKGIVYLGGSIRKDEPKPKRKDNSAKS